MSLQHRQGLGEQLGGLFGEGCSWEQSGRGKGACQLRAEVDAGRGGKIKKKKKKLNKELRSGLLVGFPVGARSRTLCTGVQVPLAPPFSGSSRCWPWPQRGDGAKARARLAARPKHRDREGLSPSPCQGCRSVGQHLGSPPPKYRLLAFAWAGAKASKGR